MIHYILNRLNHTTFDILVLDIWNFQEVMIAPVRAHFLAIEIYRDTEESKTGLDTSSDTPYRLRSCRSPPRNEEIPHRKGKEILINQYTK